MSFICTNCGEALQMRKVKGHTAVLCKEAKVSCANCDKHFVGAEYRSHKCLGSVNKWKGRMQHHVLAALQATEMDSDQSEELGQILQQNIQAWDRPMPMETLLNDPHLKSTPILKELAKQVVAKYKSELLLTNAKTLAQWRKLLFEILEVTEMSEEHKNQLKEFMHFNPCQNMKRNRVKALMKKTFTSVDLQNLATQLFMTAKDKWNANCNKKFVDLKNPMLLSLQKANVPTHLKVLTKMLETITVTPNLVILLKSLNAKLLPMKMLAAQIYNTVDEILPFKTHKTESKIESANKKWRKAMVKTLKEAESNIAHKKELGDIFKTMDKPKDLKTFTISFGAKVTLIKRAAKQQFSVVSAKKPFIHATFGKLVFESLKTIEMSPEQRTELAEKLKKRTWPRKLSKLKQAKCKYGDESLNKIAWQVISNAMDTYKDGTLEDTTGKKRKADSSDEQPTAGPQNANGQSAKKQKVSPADKAAATDDHSPKKKGKLSSSQKANGQSAKKQKVGTADEAATTSDHSPKKKGKLSSPQKVNGQSAKKQKVSPADKAETTGDHSPKKKGKLSSPQKANGQSAKKQKVGTADEATTNGDHSPKKNGKLSAPAEKHLTVDSPKHTAKKRKSKSSDKTSSEDCEKENEKNDKRSSLKRKADVSSKKVKASKSSTKSPKKKVK